MIVKPQITNVTNFLYHTCTKKMCFFNIYISEIIVTFVIISLIIYLSTTYKNKLCNNFVIIAQTL